MLAGLAGVSFRRAWTVDSAVANRARSWNYRDRDWPDRDLTRHDAPGTIDEMAAHRGVPIPHLRMRLDRISSICFAPAEC